MTLSKVQNNIIKGMPVVTLTTDWGTTDYFAGALKGAILTAAPQATVVDISHNIAHFNQVQGAFVLRNSWHHFPTGTVHISGVNDSANEAPFLIAIKYNGHFFLGPDDGFFSLVFDEEQLDAYYIQNSRGEKVTPANNVLAASASFLLKGGKISDMGDKLEKIVRKSMLQPTIEENTIKGSVLFVDSYGNVVSNITKDLFDRVSKDRDFEINIKKDDYSIEQISTGYHELGNGNLVALYNDAGYLEIAICNGNASGLLGMKYGEIVRIDFR